MKITTKRNIELGEAEIRTAIEAYLAKNGLLSADEMTSPIKISIDDITVSRIEVELYGNSGEITITKRIDHEGRYLQKLAKIDKLGINGIAGVMNIPRSTLYSRFNQKRVPEEFKKAFAEAIGEDVGSLFLKNPLAL